ncbi:MULTISPECIES: cytochrome bc complex cytochrome b subunit [unclassified Streptomyces]|uniref:cytochrome bc1 complex cytochrome b subunit n=1 Tax=unclassified Streptomyces TaxID=2593676 RepID=UPI00224F21F6|nr:MULTISPECIES: cytochrome bc complex cytochrome b subunit [unclassified Streptomyces]MCX5335431.1 cytochrome bc complex cytochrome b subunit [Streptomyces sp. NBC_00140]MCX5338177.1 cytochrome bc complex cytochrome b subunit [Streptomyces sp. NBC_00140]MCX5367433.1 cytochrome bc complex cytochrome b subunit [Streptomyces sp. NBC_00124]
MSTTERAPHSVRTTPPRGERIADWADGRLGIYSLRFLLRKVFPDHWSFMFGEIALYSFIVLILTGAWLTLFFDPSMSETVYHGSYVPLQGIPMSQAYASTLDISYEIRGGLFVRQLHHWSALIMIAALCAHTLRHFLTGSFRKPRELNWLIGFIILVLVTLEGFVGYSLPDDLLSGTGLRIAEGVTLAIPVVGTYLTLFLFGGEYPGTDIIPRFYSIHILLIPGIVLALTAAHLILVFYHKHTQFRGPGRTENNVVGQPLMPHYTAKAGGFFFLVSGVLALLAGIVQINPIWTYGPYRADQISQGSQPDWYMGFLEGALRAMPAWEFVLPGGYTVNMSVLLPAVILPGVMIMVFAAWPFLEAWITGDKREHHLLDRPREQPTRTAFGLAFVSFYLVLFFGGANDVLAQQFHLSLNQITWAVRIGLFAVPALTYVITRRICLGLQRRDRDKLLHGRETGRIKRLPHGEFVEIHERLDRETEYTLLSREMPEVLPAPEATDADGVPNPQFGKEKRRHLLSRWLSGGQIARPSHEEMRHALEHLDPDHAPSPNGHAALEEREQDPHQSRQVH